MIKKTSTEFAPWYILESVDKKYARIKALEIVIDRIKEACEKAFKIRDTLLEDLKKRSIVRFIRYHLVN